MEQKNNILHGNNKIMAQSLPHSHEIEKELLGQMILDNSIIDKIMHYIPSETVFYNDFHRSVWRGILDLRKKGTDDISINSLVAEVPPSMATKEVAYNLTCLIDVVTTATHENNAKILYEKWLLRNVIIKSEEVKGVVNVKNSDARGVLEQLHREIESVLDMQIGNGFDIDGLLDETFEKMFDEDALVVEMMKKLIVLESEKLSYEKIRIGELDENDSKMLEESKKNIRDKYRNLIMYDNIFDIDGSMREIRKHSPDVVVDDYIGLVSVSGVDDNRLRIDNIMKQYKWAAKKNNMAVLLVSQLNRECESRANKRPLLRDLRDSGSIEQDAEIILFMYYEWRYYLQESDMGEYGIEIILGKNRYGKSGRVKMGVAGDRCKIYSSSEEALTEVFNG